MTNYEKIQDFFSPKAVAVVGASEEPGKIGSGLVYSIRQGFDGAMYYVNPKYTQLFDAPCYSSVKDIPQTLTHVVIAVSRNYVLPVVEDSIALGVKNIVVISAGFKETDAIGAQLEQKITSLCAANGVSLLGPNTLGMIHTPAQYNGTFLPNVVEEGSVSVISQSGGVGMALIAALQDQQCGLRSWVGIGNEAVLDAVAFLDYFAKDPGTKAIAICFEGLRRLPEFLKLAQQVNLTKPVILLRDGVSTVGIQAAVSHTGAMAQSPEVLGQIIAQHGLLEAKSPRECAIMLKALSLAKKPKGNRVTVLSNTAGPAILAVDSAEPHGVAFPQPTKELSQAIDEAAKKHLGLKNPADISSNGLDSQTYGVAANRLIGSDEYDAMLGFFSLNPHLSLPDAQLIEAANTSGKTVVACFLCTTAELAAYDRKIEKYGIPCYCDPNDAAIALTALVAYDRLTRTVHLAAPAKTMAVDVSGKVGTLSELDSHQIFRAAGIATTGPVLTENLEQAIQLATYPAALKLHSAKITHKSEVGGVKLNIPDEEALRQTYPAMLEAMKALDEDAKLTIAPMAKDGLDMILGAVRMPNLGVVLMAGLGGIYAEIFKDCQFRLAPISKETALDMISSLRCAPILNGYRGAALDVDALAENLVSLGGLMEQIPEIDQIDCNPCRVYEKGAMALDARIHILPSASADGKNI